MSNADNNNANGDLERRDRLLLRMYDQMFNDINRHVSVIWQPITVVFGSFALIAAGVKDVIPFDFAATFIILLVGWLLATIYDSSYWYNRNLVIIANIERQFLKQSDLKHIHYYFGEHRGKQKMLTHLRIHWHLGLIMVILVLLYHFIYEVVLKMCPHFSNPPADFRWEIICPYCATLLVFIYVFYWRRQRKISYENFLKNSPGIEIDTTGIDYGIGHPIDEQAPETGAIKRIIRKVVKIPKLRGG